MEEDIADNSKKIQKLIMNDKFGGMTYNKRSNYKKKGPSKKEKEKKGVK